MTELEKLTLLMDEHTKRAVRLGYALGQRHGEDYKSDLADDASEFRVLEELNIWKPRS